MKYYRPLKNEKVIHGDYVTDDRFGLTKMVPDHCMIGVTVGDTDATGFMHYFRPVPEPRPVDKLTDEEIEKKYCGAIDRFGDMKYALHQFLLEIDELRMKPRESAKEKWIREYGETHGLPGEFVRQIRNYLSDTWDAAIASMKAKED